MFTSESFSLLPDFGIHACQMNSLSRSSRDLLDIQINFLFYTTINRNDRKLVISLPLDTRLYETMSSHSISILLGEFTGHCRLVLSSSLANCRDTYMCCVSGKS